MGSEILTDGLPLCLPNKEQYSHLITGTLYHTSSPNYNFLRYLYTFRKGVVSNEACYRLCSYYNSCYSQHLQAIYIVILSLISYSQLSS